MSILRRIALVYMLILHIASALWAGIAAATSHRAARIFLRYFGLLYLTDGLLGLATGSGYLDLGIVLHGVLDQPLMFRILANLPHIAGGSLAVFSSVFFANEVK